MALSDREAKELLRLVRRTRDREIDCETCFEHIAEFAEARSEEISISECLDAVRQHLDVCTECREELEALRSALGEPSSERVGTGSPSSS